MSHYIATCQKLRRLNTSILSIRTQFRVFKIEEKKRRISPTTQGMMQINPCIRAKTTQFRERQINAIMTPNHVRFKC
jgi:hypothetical protein